MQTLGFMVQLPRDDWNFRVYVPKPLISAGEAGGIYFQEYLIYLKVQSGEEEFMRNMRSQTRFNARSSACIHSISVSCADQIPE